MSTKSAPAILVSIVVLCLLVTFTANCHLSEATPARSPMYEEGAMTNAAAAFRKKLGGAFKALNVQIDSNSVTLRAQNPQQPANVDEYQYWATSRSLNGPRPVMLSSLENDLDRTLFDFDSVNWAATESLARAAIERTQIEAGKIEKMIVERALAIGSDATKSGSVRWTVEVKGPREHATAYADAQGRISKLDLSHTSRAAKFNLLTAETLREAVSQIDAEWGGSALVMDLELGDKSFHFKAQDPKTKEINQYFYDINGINHDVIMDMGATDQDVRRIQRGHRIEEILFPLGSIRLEQAPEFGQRAIQRLGFENARVSTIQVKREERDETSKLVTFWEVSCQAGRKWGVVTYDLNGREMGVNTW
jgi:hypothetical protein